jgi:YegS/Rv2252/BmrU family lipid kinase
MTDGGRGDGERVVILNPASGSGDHADRVHELAAERGFAVRETEESGDGVAFAREAAESGAEIVAAAGGDGTVNEVVRGIDAADELGDVTLAVVPAGTGNNFAGNVGVTGIEHAFEVIDSGRTCRIDLGYATGSVTVEGTEGLVRGSQETDGGVETGRPTERRPFVNSCVGGLTAEASGETSSDLKERFGVLAYVMTTLRLMRSFDGFQLHVERPGGGTLWEGAAIFVLVGNARRFGPKRQLPADVEDGLFDVAIVESMPPAEIVEEAAAYRLFGEESDHVTRLQAPTLEVVVESGEPMSFSFDGEMADYDDLLAEVQPGVLELFVGEGYEPNREE